MKAFYVVMFLTLLLGGCESDKTTEAESSQTQIQSQEFSGVKSIVIPEEYFELDTKHFGDFYNDRISFFTKENPQNDIYGVQPLKMELAFIDQELFQKKYELSTDITHDLITVNGKFKIRGLNKRNAFYIEQLKSQVLHRSEIISLIDHYQLRWEEEGNEIIYMVKRDTLQPSYTYIERAKGYKEIFRQIESSESG